MPNILVYGAYRAQWASSRAKVSAENELERDGSARLDLQTGVDKRKQPLTASNQFFLVHLTPAVDIFKRTTRCERPSVRTLEPGAAAFLISRC
jgi:hypothetical protein